MAPRKQRQTAAEAVASDPSQSPELDVSSSDTLPPFFNTTFAIYRASPFFLGSNALTEKRLEDLCRRLRDTLVGDVVRGIQIGVQATETPWGQGQVGPLEGISFRWFRAEEVLGGDESEDTTENDASRSKGLWLEIRHENAAYHVLMLPGATPENSSEDEVFGNRAWQMVPGEEQGHQRQRGSNDSEFLHLPLLLFRMPLPLQKVVRDWLASTFDCRVSKLHIGTKTITGVWEAWIRASGVPEGDQNTVVTLAFNAPPSHKPIDTQSQDETVEDEVSAGLRSLDISIAPADIRRFVRVAGRDNMSIPKHTPWAMDARERRRLAGGGGVDDGWGWLEDEKRDNRPFTEALAAYLNHHLALNLYHPGVRVVQISCDGFVLAQSRLKIVRRGDAAAELSRAAWSFVKLLGERTSGAAVGKMG